MDESALSEDCLDSPIPHPTYTSSLPPYTSSSSSLPPPPSYPGPPPRGATASPSLSLAGGRVSLGSTPQVVTYAAPASEPVTHFNLDQLLDIVQSFRLDTTEALNPGRKVGYAPVSSRIEQGRI